MYNNFTLDERIGLTLDYCKKKNFDDYKIQSYLSDTFYRYIHQFNDDTKLLDCIKKFYSNTEYQKRFDDLIKTYNISKLSENNRLLLIQSIFLERKYERLKE